MFGFRKHSPKSSARRVRLGIEHLEAREVLSTSAVSNLGGTLVQFNLRDDGHLLMTQGAMHTDLGAVAQGL
jgi:hypothetical protein